MDTAKAFEEMLNRNEEKTKEAATKEESSAKIQELRDKYQEKYGTPVSEEDDSKLLAAQQKRHTTISYGRDETSMTSYQNTIEEVLARASEIIEGKGNQTEIPPEFSGLAQTTSDNTIAPRSVSDTLSAGVQMYAQGTVQMLPPQALPEVVVRHVFDGAPPAGMEVASADTEKIIESLRAELQGLTYSVGAIKEKIGIDIPPMAIEQAPQGLMA
jgi:hypothetical protein